MIRRLLFWLACVTSLAAPLVTSLTVPLVTPLSAQVPTPGPAADSTVTDTLGPGLVHSYYVRQEGPWRVHVVSVDLRGGGYVVRSARALDSLRGRERTSAIAARARSVGHEVRIAMNADFFDLKSGEAVNNQVSDGRVWKALAMSGIPGGELKTARGQFGITRAGKPVIDRFIFAGVLRSGRTIWSLDGVNAIPSNGQGLVLWLPDANGRPRADSARHGREVAVHVARDDWRDSLVLHVTGRVTDVDTSPIPANYGRLVAYGATAARLDSVASLARILSVRASWFPGVGPIEQLVGGWPVIIRDGASSVDASAARELTLPSNANVRHPRSIVGFDADTSHLYFVVVDGRSSSSVGMTLAESAAFLGHLGIAHALNLDGGGSSTLVIDGKVVNAPSDVTGERPVGNALLVERRRP